MLSVYAYRIIRNFCDQPQEELVENCCDGRLVIAESLPKEKRIVWPITELYNKKQKHIENVPMEKCTLVERSVNIPKIL